MKQSLKEFIKLVVEAKEDEKKQSTKAKDKESSREYGMPRAAAPITKKEKEEKKANKSDYDDLLSSDEEDPDAGQPISRKGPSFDSFKSTGNFSVTPHDPGPNFDFDAEFDAAFKMGNAARGDFDDDISPTIGDEVKTPTMLPNQSLARIDPQGLARPMNYHSAKQEAMSILMDEIYAPGMQVGQRLLPAVFAELGRMANQDEALFKRTFAAGLDRIREVENAWFAGVLGSYPQQAQHMHPSDPKEQEMLNKMMHVLNKYFSAVMKSASKNALNLVQRTNNMKAKFGEEGFKKGFFDALSETRDLEDRLFAQHLGGMKRLPK